MPIILKKSEQFISLIMFHSHIFFSFRATEPDPVENKRELMAASKVPRQVCKVKPRGNSHGIQE